jgi:hypothetical protein
MADPSEISSDRHAGGGITTEGARSIPSYGRRLVKQYPVTDAEMGQLSTLNKGEVKWRSLEALAFGCLLGLLGNTFPKTGWADWSASPPTVGAIIIAGLAIWLFRSEAKRCETERSNELTRIKDETKFE